MSEQNTTSQSPGCGRRLWSFIKALFRLTVLALILGLLGVGIFYGFQLYQQYNYVVEKSIPDLKQAQAYQEQTNQQLQENIRALNGRINELEAQNDMLKQSPSPGMQHQLRYGCRNRAYGLNPVDSLRLFMLAAARPAAPAAADQAVTNQESGRSRWHSILHFAQHLIDHLFTFEPVFRFPAWFEPPPLCTEIGHLGDHFVPFARVDFLEYGLCRPGF